MIDIISERTFPMLTQTQPPAPQQAERIVRSDRYVIDCALDVIVARKRPTAERDEGSVSRRRAEAPGAE